MTDELDTLRPEVREAFSRLNQDVHLSPQSFMDWTIIRAELLRLAALEQNAKLPDLMARANRLIARGAANERAEKAEAELAALKARIADGIHVRGFYGPDNDGAWCAYPDKLFVLVKVEE